MPPKKTTGESAPKKRKAASKNDKGSAVQDNFSKIQTRAFELFMDRIKSNKPGDAMSDWLRAEEDIRKRHRI